jgi:hypothetical protein
LREGHLAEGRRQECGELMAEMVVM